MSPDPRALKEMSNPMIQKFAQLLKKSKAETKEVERQKELAREELERQKELAEEAQRNLQAEREARQQHELDMSRIYSTTPSGQGD